MWRKWMSALQFPEPKVILDLLGPGTAFSNAFFFFLIFFLLSLV